MKDQSKTKQTLIKKNASLDKANEYAENIINTVREPLIVLDQDLRVVTASRSFYEFFKVKPEETEGQLIYNLGNKQWDIPKLRELLETILPQKTTFDNYEVEHDFAIIGRRVMLLNARQIQRVLGKELIILLAIEDITKHKRLENILTDSEELYKGVFNNASDGILLLEKREGKIVHVNPAAEKMLGYTAEESIGNKLQDIGFMFNMDDFQTIMQNLNKNHIINYTNVPLTTKSKQHMDTDIYLVNKTKVVQCNIRDVTERKQAEEALQDSEAQFKALYQESPIPTFTWQKREDDFLLVNFNHAAILITDGRVYNFLGKRAEELYQNQPMIIENMRRCFTEHSVIRQDILSKHFAPGKSLSAHYAFVPPDLIIVHTEDQTVRKQAEAALLQSEEKYRTILESIQEAYFEVDFAGNFTFVNDSLCRNLGYSKEELMGMNYRQYTDKEHSKNLFQTFNKVFYTGEPTEGFDWQIIRKDGTKRYVEASVSLQKDSSDKPTGFEGIVRDITERNLAEVELKQTLESLRKSFAATVQVMVSAIESRDPYTSGHQSRSADLARAIATEMGLTQEKIEGIRMASSIHDIGKISIPAEILSKPTKLTDIEFSLIKEHPRKGYEMLKDIESPWPLAQIVYQHHERMNGSGYPRNLKGDEIIMEARIMAVADVVEAMASHRPYRAALGIEAALAEIEKNKGTHYDNTVAHACLRLFREKGYQLT